MKFYNLMADIANVKLLYFKSIDLNPSHSDYYRKKCYLHEDYEQIKEF